jgi:protocatechuate 3,4-dioxygenase beta subunit
MRRNLLILFLVFVASACGAQEPVLGLPCEGCEAVFEGRPANPPSRARIAPPGSKGEPMLLRGRVLDATGKPRAGIVVYAYHTDAGGIYPTSDASRGTASHRHGLLRGWATSDAQGRYAFDTIRPAGYPGTGLPQHVHMHVIEPGCGTYWIDDVHFSDDPRLTATMLSRVRHGRGGDGVVTPTRVKGVWQATRDIVLGKGIPGYTACRR